MADTSSKRTLFRTIAILGVVVLIAGAIMFLLASRQMANIGDGSGSPLSLGLGVAGLVVVLVGAVIAIVGGLGMVVAGGKPISLLSLLLIPVGVALDFALAWLNTTLKLPLFLDSVGHILAGMLGGPVIGGVTGFLGVLTNSAFQPSAIVWCFQGMTIGIVVGLLAEAGMFKNWRRAIIAALIVIVVSITMSSVISIIVYGGIDTYTSSVLVVFFQKIGMALVPAVVLKSTIIELVDKAISVGLPFLVIQGMSSRLLNQFVTGPKLREFKTETVADAKADDNVTPADLEGGGYGSYADKK